MRITGADVAEAAVRHMPPSFSVTDEHLERKKKAFIILKRFENLKSFRKIRPNAF